jgi:cytochrome b pre-mRNA-processing protein 3
MGNLFYGLLASLDSALDANDVAGVEAVLVRNIYDAAPDAVARPLAEYLIAESRRLAGRPASELTAGRLDAGQAA